MDSLNLHLMRFLNGKYSMLILKFYQSGLNCIRITFLHDFFYNKRYKSSLEYFGGIKLLDVVDRVKKKLIWHFSNLIDRIIFLG